METREKELITSEIARSVKAMPAILIIAGLLLSVLMVVVSDGELFGRAGMEYDVMFIIGILLIAAAIVLLLYISKCSMTVTEKRVYGKAAFGKMVDLPMDSISAVGIGFLQSVTVATASGRISFNGIANRDAIYKVISELIANRSTNSGKIATVNNIKAATSAEELKQYKELLEQGIINQDEFDAKKKQLLGI